MQRFGKLGNISARLGLILVLLLNFSFISFFPNTDVVGTHHSLKESKAQKKPLAKKWIVFPSEEEEGISVAWESDSTEYDPQSSLTDFLLYRTKISNGRFDLCFCLSETLLSLLIDIPPPALA
ncbi:hypothetical protein EHQ53_16340 [Leptospira langatensis]|uniref:Uncharacterized protein n=1 Tax=Leptospira langatensis TaxID=2484983 RepID=A0A5F1ZQG1_9LEPT|nr:hypothetical protein [Leptospira langatensis]TGK05211.1 hypothetical protein EHO57_00585 [Leptospira langatensis]TGL38346.1 hypothetical protein EHQ53_16340 [Leptospira langatensis]